MRSSDAACAQLAALERARQRPRLERARIARELHDIVAHSLSRHDRAGRRRRGIARQRPAAAAAALRTIDATGREALGQMRRLLGVLREERDAGRRPRRGRRTSTRSSTQSRRRPAPPTAVGRGEPRPLGPRRTSPRYRVVQEALTNVLKHAGAVRSRRRHASRHGADAVELVVRDDGRRRARGRATVVAMV